jgi:hypothetical protein
MPSSVRKSLAIFRMREAKVQCRRGYSATRFSFLSRAPSVAFDNKSISRGVMAVVSYLATFMVWLTAGFEMWESGLALHNGCQLWYCRLMSGQDHGDETKTRTNTSRQRGEGTTLWLRGGRQYHTWVIHFERDGQPQTETWTWIGCKE